MFRVEILMSFHHSLASKTSQICTVSHRFFPWCQYAVLTPLTLAHKNEHSTSGFRSRFSAPAAQTCMEGFSQQHSHYGCSVSNKLSIMESAEAGFTRPLALPPFPPSLLPCILPSNPFSIWPSLLSPSPPQPVIPPPAPWQTEHEMSKHKSAAETDRQQQTQKNRRQSATRTAVFTKKKVQPRPTYGVRGCWCGECWMKCLTQHLA